ncbi:PQQ-dependent sugar dehydrogenase [Alkalicoccus daliensis]|uniref:Glucose/arabinose dehydrogenase, beta-propeller fold n=1 Tax=Alkalicoccus daliensis TaxID=745820 RepID=A0A1H0GWB5_9BACI|nr:PQQ-dependent sugar dehydrogenase [Alkalicoccus daliensis]SDO11158.1 Glucose/arabinose dehydrogenase, beta-propeller fold [Alkalicoccus daliensis]
MYKAASLFSLLFLVSACQANNEENNVDVVESPQNNESNNDDNNSDEAVDPINNSDNNQNEAENTQEENNINDEDTLTNTNIEDWNVETLADQLSTPWTITLSEDAEVIHLTSREGHILEITEGEEPEQIEMRTSDPIVEAGEGGLLGFELLEEEEAFLYYTYEGGETGLSNRIVRAERTEDGWEETDILLDEIEGAQIHNGGRLALGPDDMLYATTGDADEPDWSQDEGRLAGSILRMTTEGEIPDDNPLDDSYVYSYGHRNPQGLAWNTEEELYSSEHGAQALDEVNIIEPGNNYGWPVIEGSEEEEGMETPALHSGETTWAPSGAAFWEDEFITVGLRGESVYVFNEEEEEMHITYEGEGRLRDVVVHDNALYIITNNTDGRGNPGENDDRLLRLTRD